MKPRQTMWVRKSGSYQLSDQITPVGREETKKKFILNTIYHNPVSSNPPILTANKVYVLVLRCARY